MTQAPADRIRTLLLRADNVLKNQGDSADDYIVDGITDEVRGKLARVNGLAVIASGSSAQYRGSDLAPAAARKSGREQVADA